MKRKSRRKASLAPAVRTEGSPSAGERTREKILDAAEALFSELGPEAASLRDITAKARVNLGSVNYHFKSKEALFAAVFERRVHPLNEERLRRLDEFESAAHGEPLPVEKILEALIAPLLELALEPALGGHKFLRLMGRSLYEPGRWMKTLIEKEFDPLIQRFRGALVRTFPQTALEDLWWRVHFTVGAMLHTAYHQYKLETASRGLCKGSDIRAATENLVAFAAAGFREDLGRSAKKSP